MALGIFAVWLGFASIGVALIAYWLVMIRSLRADRAAASGNGARGNGKTGRGVPAPAAGAVGSPAGVRGPLLLARRAFYLSCGCVAVAAVVLESLILSKRYEVEYIWKTTNEALPFFYRLASFWSNQEGTFILWGLYGSILGLVFLRKSAADERWVMPFFCFVQAYLFFLMATMSAFKMHPLQGDLLQMMGMQEIPVPKGAWEKFVYLLGFAPVFSPPDGQGLNESLQNPWMVIHPPTLFVGYAAMVMPSCFAMGALVRREYDTWVNRAAPWLLFAWVVLGTGIFLGAYWAYETLGWGGYWAWDPVENSSLIPWIFGTALLHGMLAQRARGNFKHANLFLGFLVFLAVLYGSFLTRSGVLEGMSVHSFASPGYAVYVGLLVLMLVWLVLGLGLWIWRYKDIQSEIAYDSVWERHFGFFLGMIVLCASALIVSVAVIAPKLLLVKLFVKGAVQYTYYNRAILPIAFVMLLLMAITPLAPWRQARDRAHLKPFDKVALAVAGLLGVAFLPAGFYATMSAQKSHYGPALFVFAAAALLLLVTNSVMLFRTRRAGVLLFGAWLAHISFGLVMVGVVITSHFSRQQKLEVPVGEARSAFGYNFTYRGMYVPPRNSHAHEAMRIEVSEPGQRPLVFRTPFFESQVSASRGEMMAWPRIWHRWWGDVYIAPNGRGGILSLKDMPKGGRSEEVPVPQSTGEVDMVHLRFLDYEMGGVPPRDAIERGEAIRIGAKAALVVNGKEYPITPWLSITPGAKHSEPLAVTTREGRQYSVALTDVHPNERTAGFNLGVGDSAVFTVMTIPGIHVLWGGCYLLILGGFLAYRRRAVLARRSLPESQQLRERSRRLRSDS